MIDLSSEELTFLIETVVKPLAEMGATVYCYGSRSRGEARPFSDVDLMVVSDSDLSRLLSGIRERLEDSNFPYIVDIVEEHAFAESYKPSYLAERVLLTPDMAEA